MLQEDIVKIYKETPLKRVIVIDALVDSYGGKRREEIGFLKNKWDKIKHTKVYRYRDALDGDSIEYFENLSDHEWYERYHKIKISDFTDEEIVNEFNRRLKCKLFHKVTFVGEAKIEDNR